jgi:hypothetical protein
VKRYDYHAAECEECDMTVAAKDPGLVTRILLEHRESCSDTWAEGVKSERSHGKTEWSCPICKAVFRHHQAARFLLAVITEHVGRHAVKLAGGDRGHRCTSCGSSCTGIRSL